MSKCRHKKLIMAVADYVQFIPDDEPFTSGVVEHCGLDEIEVSEIIMCYCPKCNIVVSLDASGAITTTPS